MVEDGTSTGYFNDDSGCEFGSLKLQPANAHLPACSHSLDYCFQKGGCM